MKQKNIIRTAGIALIGAALGAIPSYFVGRELGYNNGRESAQPVSISVRNATNGMYRYLEGVWVTDVSGKSTSMFDYMPRETEQTSRIFPEDGFLITQNYHPLTFPQDRDKLK